jgi:Ca2+-binding EF-hand superfamily protein
MIQAADANQDGVIDYQEFLDVITREYKKNWS